MATNVNIQLNQGHHHNKNYLNSSTTLLTIICDIENQLPNKCEFISLYYSIEFIYYSILYSKEWNISIK